MFQSKHWSNISEWHCDVHKHSDAAFVPSFPPRLQTNNRLYQFYGSLSIIYASKWFSVPFLQIPPVMPLWIMKRKVFLKSFVSVTRALKILWDNVSLVFGNIITIFKKILAIHLDKLKLSAKENVIFSRYNNWLAPLELIERVVLLRGRGVSRSVVAP